MFPLVKNFSTNAPFNKLKNFVLNNDVASLQAELAPQDNTSIVNGCDYDGSTLLFLAAEKNFVDIAKLLLRAKANVNHNCSHGRGTALIVAAGLGHDRMVKLLLEHAEIAIDLPNNNRYTALMRAALNGHTAVIQQLLDVGASVHCSLLAAGYSGHCDLIQLLLSYQANVDDVDAGGRSCLHFAAMEGRDDAVRLLLSANAAPNLVDQLGNTALLRAAMCNYPSVVRTLLAAGAVANCDSAMEQPLHYAVSNECPTLVDDLLQAGANPNARYRRGATPLMYAAQLQDTTALCSLLQANANVNMVQDIGGAALHFAISHNATAAVKLLLDNGADILAEAKESAKQLARQTGNTEIQSLFLCSLCGWSGMCCAACRKKFCVIRCDKYSGLARQQSGMLLLFTSILLRVDRLNYTSTGTRRWAYDCKLHEKMAHDALVDWTIAMAPLHFPPYVLEMIFDAAKWNSSEEDYQKRLAAPFIGIPPFASSQISENFIHLILEEREHQQNIRLFISVHKANQNRA